MIPSITPVLDALLFLPLSPSLAHVHNSCVLCMLWFEDLLLLMFVLCLEPLESQTPNNGREQWLCGSIFKYKHPPFSMSLANLLVFLMLSPSLRLFFPLTISHSFDCVRGLLAEKISLMILTHSHISNTQPNWNWVRWITKSEKVSISILICYWYT